MKHNACFRHIALVSIVYLSGISASALAADADEEARKQAARQISDAIAARIADVAIAAPAPGESAAEQLSNSAWGAVQYIDISDDELPPGGAGFEAETVLGIWGVDHRINNFFIGLSMSYADTDSTTEGTPGTADTDGDSHNFSVGPYAAWLFTENMFLSTSLRYNTGEAETEGSGDTDSDGFAADVILNGVWASNNWVTKAKFGYRYNETDADTESSTMTVMGLATPITIAASSTETSSDTIFFDGEIGYRFAPAWLGFVGLQYTDQVDSDISPTPMAGAGSTSADDTTWYVRTGLNFDVSDRTKFTIASDVEFGNEDIDLWTIGANLRIAF